MSVALADWSVEGDQVEGEHGAEQAFGDFNGDGYSDVVVTTYLFDDRFTDEGVVYVYNGSARGLEAAPSWVHTGGADRIHFGRAIGCAGDVNGDGYDDLIVGAPTYSNDPVDGTTGAVFLFLGSASGLSAAPAWSLSSDQHGDRFGRAVGAAGDVNGDGYGDVIVGAYYYDNGETNEGKVWIFYGSAAGLHAVADWSAESNQVGAGFGWGATTAGDVNGDGYDDVIVGAPVYDSGEGPAGRVYLYFGSPTGLAREAAWTAESPESGASFGRSVACAGDVNGDGYSDVIVGARQFDAGCDNLHEGAALVYLGSASGPGKRPAWVAVGHEANSYQGHAIRGAGDINDDGFDDVVVGEPYEETGSDVGEVMIFLGSPQGLPTAPSWTIEGDQAGAQFGSWVTGGGDVDGDGLGDLLVSAWRYDGGEVNEGKSYLFAGSSIVAHPCALAAQGVSDDFGRDGRADILWRRRTTGRLGLYQMNGAQILSACPTPYEASPGWTIVGTGDFNGDGRTDILWLHPQLGLRLWMMDGLVVAADATVHALADFDWQIKAVGDLNGDGRDDLLWRNRFSGRLRALFMNGAQVVGGTLIEGIADPLWDVAAVADFDADGTDDLVWRHAVTGETWVSLIDDGVIRESARVVHHTAARLIGARDIDGDGAADIVWYDPDDGTVTAFLMKGASVTDASRIGRVSDPSVRPAGLADFDGDGRADVLWRDSLDGALRLWTLDGFAIVADAPVPGALPPDWEIQNLRP